MSLPPLHAAVDVAVRAARSRAVQRAEVDPQQHRDDHHPDKQPDRHIHARDFHPTQHLDRRGKPLAKRNAGDNAQRDPQGEPTLEHTEQRRHACRGKLARRHAPVLPMSRNWLCSERRSSLSSGRLASMRVRFRRTRATSANALRFSSSLPTTVAGSGTPQCAITG